MVNVSAITSFNVSKLEVTVSWQVLINYSMYCMHDMYMYFRGIRITSLNQYIYVFICFSMQKSQMIIISHYRNHPGKEVSYIGLGEGSQSLVTERKKEKLNVSHLLLVASFP